MKEYLSCSALSRVQKCPASAVLPSIKSTGDATENGTAFHRIMEVRGELRSEGLSKEAAFERSMLMIDEIAEQMGLSAVQKGMVAKKAKSIKWSPPPGASLEAWFCMNRDFESRQLEVPKGRSRPEIPADAVYVGIADVAYPEDGVAIVGDYKSGSDAHVQPISSNMQLWTLGIMVASAWKCEAFVPAIIYANPECEDGVWECPARLPISLDGDRAKAHRQRLTRLTDSVQALRKRSEAGEDISDACVTGPHCGFCPCSWACPHHASLIRGVLGLRQLSQPKKMREPLDPSEIVTLAQQVSTLTRIANTSKEILKNWVNENGPIDISKDTQWGVEVSSEDQLIINESSLRMLYNVFGDAYYQLIRVSKTGIYDLSRVMAAKEGTSTADFSRRVMGEFGVLNCIEQVETKEYKEMRKPEVDK